MTKVDDILIKCMNKETGEEGYVSLGSIGEAIIEVLLSDPLIQRKIFWR